MASENETVDDILAEMRKGMNPNGTAECQYLESDICTFSDRIEAAWKREREHVGKTDMLGNMAKMREALIRLHEWAALDLNENTYLEQKSGNYLKLIEGILKITNAALSAPARNCDRFADETDAQIAFLNEVWLISVDRKTMLVRDKYENWSDEMRTRYGRWLFAPAEERKGDCDGCD